MTLMSNYRVDYFYYKNYSEHYYFIYSCAEFTFYIVKNNKKYLI